MTRNSMDDNKLYREQAQHWLAEYASAFSGSARQGLSLQDDVELGRAWMRLKDDAGYGAISWPQAYGGAGGTEIQKIIFAEEELRYNLPTDYFAVSLGMPVPVILRYGTEGQKQRYVAPAIRGEEIWCQLFSEPSAGSDLAALRLRARREGDNWILNGQKVWTTWAQLSDFGVVVARHDPSLPKHRGLTYFFVDMNTPGIEVRIIKKLDGARDFNEVFFNDVKVPDTQRLGDVGAGFAVALDTLMIERYAVTDEAGWGPKLVDFIAFAKQARVKGRPAMEDERVRAEIASFYVEEVGLASIHARALTAIQTGREPGPEGSIRKLVVANKRQRMAALAMDLAGPCGILCEPGASTRTEFQASWLDSPCLRIAGGTDEILRNTLAERVLGLPKDHRPDKGRPFSELKA